MRNCFLITVMAVAVACSGDDDSSSSPLQPSPLTTPAGVGPRGFAGGPPVSPAGLTAGADAAGGGIAQLAPAPDDFNAYNAQIEYIDGEVTITFVPVDMPGMPDAAREYRNRAVTVRHCPVEPHHVNQRCGEPVFQDSFAFLGSPSRTFTLPECAGWLVIEAAELSDDRYDGWRNAPLACRTDEAGRAVTSVDTDGNGPGWEDSRFDPPARAEPESERVQRVVDEAIAAAAGRFVPGADPVSVSVAELFEDTGGTAGDDYRATSSDPTVATVEITPNPRMKITPVGPGRTTIRVDNLRSGERVEFDVTVEEPGNRPPAITNPGSKAYEPGQAIEAFRIAVTDPDEDTVTVTVTGLPDGLTWSSETGRVSGTVAADAAARAYTVTVTANDGTSDAVTATFTITIAVGNMPPAIPSLTDRTYKQGQTIEAFSIAVTDPDEDTVTVTVTGLPDSLEWSSESGRVSGTVAAAAAAQPYPVTVTANDGTNDAVTATFTITVTENMPPTITNPGDKEYGQRETIEAFSIAVSDPDGDDVTVTVAGLPGDLTWADGMVSGTVSSSAAVRDYRVTVTANDGVNDPVTAEFTITVIPTWILLADSLTATRGNMGFPGYPFTGAGPDGGGTWPLRWARWYYAEGEPGWTIVQFYSEGSWAHGGSRNVGCSVLGPGDNPRWTTHLLPSGTSRLTGGAELLPSGTPARRLDGSGNPIPRVPTGYSDDPARLWTMRFPRSSTTRLTSECLDNVWTGSGGELYFTTVPLPPSP